MTDVPAATDGGREHSPGPLAGVRVIEFAGLGPVPFAAMLLAGMGADVVRIARPGDDVAKGSINRDRRIVGLDMTDETDRATAFDLVTRADVLLEGYRPGVLERMGLAPERLHNRNPALVIGRMSAWGQEGPLAQVPGHDINVLALCGLLAAIGSAERPTIPLNLIADYGGGALYLSVGVLAALLSAQITGLGQTIDCAMIDGTASLMTLHSDMWQSGRATAAREDGLLDGGAPFYAVYACADESFVAVGAIEPKFYDNLLKIMGLADDLAFAQQHDRESWPLRKARLTELFQCKTRAEWLAVFEGVEACVTPVLNLAEAMELPHFRVRGVFLRSNDKAVPAPAPRFGSTPRASTPSRLTDPAEVAADWRSPSSLPISRTRQESR